MYKVLISFQIILDHCLFLGAFIKNPSCSRNDDVSGVRYLTDAKSPAFRFQLEASRRSSHTEELWYNESLRMTIFKKQSFQLYQTSTAHAAHLAYAPMMNVFFKKEFFRLEFPLPSVIRSFIFLKILYICNPKSLMGWLNDSCTLLGDSSTSHNQQEFAFFL